MAQNSSPPTKAQKQPGQTISVRIDRLVNRENSSIRAIASATIGGSFAVHGLCVVDSQKGLFVRMPQESYQKDGQTVYTDIFHPVTGDARNELSSKVLSAYEQCLNAEVTEAEASYSPDEANTLTPNM